MMNDWLDGGEVWDIFKQREDLQSFEAKLRVAVSEGEIATKAGFVIVDDNGRIENRRDWDIPASTWVKKSRAGSIPMFSLVDGELWGTGYRWSEAPDWFMPGDILDIENITIKLRNIVYHRDDLLRYFRIRGAVETKTNRASTLQMTAKDGSRAGAKVDIVRWAQFGAALAYVANVQGVDQFTSRAQVYSAVAEYLTLRNCTPLDERTVRMMIDLARAWVGEGEDPEQWLATN